MATYFFIPSIDIWVPFGVTFLTGEVYPVYRLFQSRHGTGITCVARCPVTRHLAYFYPGQYTLL